MSDINKILQQSKEALAKALAEKKRNENIIKGLANVIKPVLQEIADNSKLNKEEILQALSQIKVDIPKLDIPKAEVEVKLPEIPKAEVIVKQEPISIPALKTEGIERAIERSLNKFKIQKPEISVNVPPIKIPKMQWPESNMPIEGWVRLMGVDLKNPLPVQLRDKDGKPVNLIENITNIIGGGGGAAHIVQVSGFGQSAYADYLNADNRLRVSVESGGGGLTDIELRASAVPVSQVSGAVNSSQVKLVARTTNPTATADGSSVFGSADDLGRQLNRPIQVRDLIATAYTTLNSNSETTLLAGGGAGVFHDLIWVKFSNTSTEAVAIDLRDVTAGNIVDTWEVPGNGVVGVSSPVPYPQGNANNNWSVKFNDTDISATTVYISALFSKEI